MLTYYRIHYCSMVVRNPQDIAASLGLQAVELDFSIMYPAALFTKPVICVQDYIQVINNSAGRGTRGIILSLSFICSAAL